MRLSVSPRSSLVGVGVESPALGPGITVATLYESGKSTVCRDRLNIEFRGFVSALKASLMTVPLMFSIAVDVLVLMLFDHPIYTSLPRIISGAHCVLFLLFSLEQTYDLFFYMGVSNIKEKIINKVGYLFFRHSSAITL